jgi:hypothetical protein
MTLYYHFKKCDQSRKRPHRDELFLHKTTHYGDLKQLENTYLKYASGSSFKIRIAQMEGEEIFGSYKRKVNLLPNQNVTHISMIMSIILNHVSTSRLANHMCKLSELLIMIILMNIWITLMEVLRSCKLHVEMEYGI